MSPKKKSHSTVLVKLKNVRYNCSDYIFTQSYIPHQNVFLPINITIKLISVNKEKIMIFHLSCPTNQRKTQ